MDNFEPPKTPRNLEKLRRVHSDILSKAVTDRLAKVTPQELEQDGIVMSKELVQDLPQAEIKYLLDNMIPPEELMKMDQIQASLTSLALDDENFFCQYCKKPKRNPNEMCCASKEIQVYLTKCEDQKLLKRFSSYSLTNSSNESIQASLENVKQIGEMHKTIQERKSKISLNRLLDIKKDKDKKQMKDEFKYANFEKDMGTFVRLQKKLENIQKYCPEVYATDESIIAMWAGSSSTSKEDKTHDNN